MHLCVTLDVLFPPKNFEALKDFGSKDSEIDMRGRRFLAESMLNYFELYPGESFRESIVNGIASCISSVGIHDF